MIKIDREKNCDEYRMYVALYSDRLVHLPTFHIKHSSEDLSCLIMIVDHQKPRRCVSVRIIIVIIIHARPSTVANARN